ncbi:hypothetical protein [Streptomyces sp. NPDC002785]|uniref:hypothetical protein n=1 Tax=Streptomyces sp. NPDC002785 TaxID=3154543 RepID=UPI00332B834E
MEYLVTGHHRQAAELVRDTDADAALVFYLSKADPLLVLRDLPGHSTVLTTEKYGRGKCVAAHARGCTLRRVHARPARRRTDQEVREYDRSVSCKTAGLRQGGTEFADGIVKLLAE